MHAYTYTERIFGWNQAKTDIFLGKKYMVFSLAKIVVIYKKTVVNYDKKVLIHTRLFQTCFVWRFRLALYRKKEKDIINIIITHTFKQYRTCEIWNVIIHYTYLIYYVMRKNYIGFLHMKLIVFRYFLGKKLSAVNISPSVLWFCFEKYRNPSVLVRIE